jgi:hypothetical protein
MDLHERDLVNTSAAVATFGVATLAVAAVSEVTSDVWFVLISLMPNVAQS